MRPQYYLNFPKRDRGWWIRTRLRRLKLRLADSPVLRLLAALGILTSGYLTLFLLMGGW